jgi:hypothetical protein
MNRSQHSKSRIKPTQTMSAAMRARASHQQRTTMRAQQSSTHAAPQSSDNWLNDCLSDYYNKQGGQPR